MGYGSFLAWVARVGWQVVGKQKYLNKVWQEASKGGKEILKSQWPKLLNKAKDYYKNFKGADLKSVKKEKSFIELMKDKGHKFLAKDSPEYLAHIKKTKVVPKKEVVNIGDRIIKKMQKQGKTVKFDDIVRIYGKKPPNLKADGGRIDKALPGRSRDI